MPECPVCRREAEVRDNLDPKHVNCQTCGQFSMTATAAAVWPAQCGDNPERVPLLSHAIRKRQRAETPPTFDSNLVKQIISESSLPAIAQQADNLVLFMGRMCKTPEARINIDKAACAAIIGAQSPDTARWFAAHLAEQGYLHLPGGEGLEHVGLTFKGWQHYEQLRRAAKDSRTAFMAMPFGNADLDRLFADYYRPAAGLAGYELRRIDEAPPAGSIDDRLRVEIRKSRFLVVDLTGDNSGAYWEAGFAEGLEKPVIYSCETTFFDDVGTHFDTSHWHTIKWAKNDMEAAAESLKATIRATLPDEAKLTDDE